MIENGMDTGDQDPEPVVEWITEINDLLTELEYSNHVVVLLAIAGSLLGPPLLSATPTTGGWPRRVIDSSRS